MSEEFCAKNQAENPKHMGRIENIIERIPKHFGL